MEASIVNKKLFTLVNAEVRQRAAKYISNEAPDGYRVEIKEPKRNLEQNSKLWPALHEISEQVEHHGRKYDAETWKAIMMNALGQEMRFVPTLDGKSVFPLGMRSSELSKREMSELIEFIIAWGVQNGVKFHDAKDDAA